MLRDCSVWSVLLLPLLVYQQFMKKPKWRLKAFSTFKWQEHVRLSSACLSV